MNIKILMFIIRFSDKIVKTIALAVALLLMSFSLYAIYDSLYIKNKAFVSDELLRYKPTENGPGFEEISQVNPDVVAWLTVTDTNIDYPLVQGRNDIEYSAKDIYGQTSLTGSIYLSVKNSADLSDGYNLVYGHNIDNGAMFGDIKNFRDKEYYDAHKQGYVLTPKGNFALRIFACTETDAYTSAVYSVYNKNYRLFFDYLAENSVHRDEEVSLENVHKIIVLSTCDNARTNGRLLLVGDLTPCKDLSLLPGYQAGQGQCNTPPSGAGQGKALSVANVICLCCTVVILLPICRPKKNISLPPEEAKKKITGYVLEIVLTLVSALFMAATQGFENGLCFTDETTPVVLAVLAAVFVVDLAFFDYEGKKKNLLLQKPLF